MSQIKELTLQGLWKNNPGLVQLLGLCPLLAVTATVTNALGLGAATLLVLLGSNIAVSLVRNYVAKEIRIPVFVLIIASLVTVVQLLMNAYTYDLYLSVLRQQSGQRGACQRLVVHNQRLDLRIHVGESA